MRPKPLRTSSSSGPAPSASPPATGRAPAHPGWLALSTLVLVAGVLLALHGSVLRWPFISDDFIFILLGRTRGARELFGAFDVVQNYFRPVGRELYFFVLHHLAGSDPRAYHAVNFGILLAIHALLFRLAWRMAGVRAAVLGTAVYALLYPHRLEMGWISCSQDLLATAFGVAAVLAHQRSRGALAGVLLFVGLLAKESIAPLAMVIAAAEAWSAPPGTRPAARLSHGFRRASALWLATAAWIVVVIAVRTWKGAWAPGQSAAVADVALDPGSLWEGFRAGLSTYVYLDQPSSYLGEALAHTRVPWLAMLFVAALAVQAFRWPARAVAPDGARGPTGARDALGLGALWAVLGALPPALAGHHFSAYYMNFAAVGFALFAGVLLASARIPVVLALLLVATELDAVANGVEHFRLTAHTEDLPGVGYVTVARLRREVRFLDSLEVALRRASPPRGAIIYLSHAPKGVSFATAGERAPKVWFDDPRLELSYITGYQPGDRSRPTRFLRYDEHTQGFVPLPRPLVDGIVASERLLSLGAWAQARDTIRAALAAAEPGTHELERIELLNDLGMVDWRLDDKPAARATWTAAAAEAPEHVGVQLNLTVLEADAGRFPAALEHVNRVLALEPDHPLALLFRARIERELGQESQAQATWARLATVHPAYADSVQRSAGRF